MPINSGKQFVRSLKNNITKPSREEAERIWIGRNQLWCPRTLKRPASLRDVGLCSYLCSKREPQLAKTTRASFHDDPCTATNVLLSVAIIMASVQLGPIQGKVNTTQPCCHNADSANPYIRVPRLKQQEINAASVVCLGMGVFYILFPPPALLLWLPGVLLVKLVMGFALRRER